MQDNKKGGWEINPQPPFAINYMKYGFVLAFCNYLLNPSKSRLEKLEKSEY